MLAATVLAAGLLLAPACTFAPAPAWPRPALPLPTRLAECFDLPEAPQLRSLEPDAAAGVTHGVLTCGDEEVRFHLHEAGDGRGPVVLLVPILAGGRDLMLALARMLVARGYSTVWCERVAPALVAPQRGRDLETLFRRTVVHQRAVLAWLRSREADAPRRHFALGVSMGGMVTVALTAVEPGLDGAAICLSGGDLPSIVIDSAEVRVEQWRQWRLEVDGLASTMLQHELHCELHSDPARLAAFIETDRVFLVAAAFDAVIRPRHQDLLWEALGRPDRLTVPLGHYSAALALGPIMTAVTGFYGDRLLELAGRGGGGRAAGLAAR